MKNIIIIIITPIGKLYIVIFARAAQSVVIEKPLYGFTGISYSLCLSRLYSKFDLNFNQVPNSRTKTVGIIE